MAEPKSETLLSHHIFLFPFKWDYLPAGKNILELPFSERTQMRRFEGALQGMPWVRSPFSIQVDEEDKYHTYNEYHYFYGYVRDALALSLNEQDAKQRFRYKLPEKGEEVPQYHIKVKSGEGTPSHYRLVIKDILLTTYSIGVGYLAFFLENYETDKREDILCINDYGRRIYPQFLGYPGEDGRATDAPKGSFLASEIAITGLETPITEDFSYYDNASTLQGEPYQLPAHISALLGEQFRVGTRESQQRYSSSYLLLNPLIDDRMFTHCIYYSPDGLEELRKYDQAEKQYAYVNNDFWYAYLFVDPTQETTCHSQPMKERLVKTHTYDRWLCYENKYGHQSHLFGVSRYSFMILAERQWYAQAILLNHHRYIYFQMIALALMQRGAIIRFSAEAANISESITENLDPARQKKSIREIYRGYLYFTNKINFREVTPQEQGIELYDMARKAMEIDPDMQALHQEVGELHQYAVLLDGEKSNKEAERLTWIATIFLPFSIVGAYFGFSNLPKGSIASDFFYFFLVSILLIGAILIITWTISKIRKP